jgi:hypothetical protein
MATCQVIWLTEVPTWRFLQSVAITKQQKLQGDEERGMSESGLSFFQWSGKPAQEESGVVVWGRGLFDVITR